MTSLASRLCELVQLVLLPEVNFVDGLLNLALEAVLEVADLIVLRHAVARDAVAMQTGAQLVVRVLLHFFLQLSPDILVLVLLAQGLVQLRVCGRFLHGLLPRLGFHGLFGCLFGHVVLEDLFALLVELDDEIMFLSISKCHVRSNHFF